jgi:putative phage-type endonuclease
MDIAKELLCRESRGEFPEQKTKKWYEMRKLMLTASEISSCLDCNIHTSSYELLLKKLEPVNEMTTGDAINWGVKFEPIALQFYEFIKKEKVHSLGLVQHTEYKWIGASPDGILMSGKLLEIKCPYKRTINDNIPIYYWIQVQIQLEVCNLEECDYLECKFHQYNNKKDYDDDVYTDTNLKGIHVYENKDIYWKILTYSIKTIKRDRLWFSQNLEQMKDFHDKLSYYIIHGKKVLKIDMKKLRKNQYHNKKRKLNMYKSNILIDWKYWVSATSIRNYIMDDPLIDWLNYYNTSKINNITAGAPCLNFQQCLMNKGLIFENAIMEIMHKKFPNEIVTVANVYQAKSRLKFLETVNHINNGTPIIYQGVLHDDNRKIFGMPDLLVRSDYIDKIFKNDNIHKSTDTNSKYHYKVIEIKYSSLILCSNGKYLRNSNKNISAYKSQLYLYTKILGDIQNYTPSKAYIIGKKWSYTKNNQHISGESFDKPAVINFNHEKLIRKKTANAIKWVRRLRFKGHKWTISPPSVDELKPNMCNIDNKWEDVKKHISESTNEITQLWMCGVKNRKIAELNKITNWRTHPKLTSENLGVCGDKTAHTLQLIIDYNQNIDIDYDNLIYPKKITTNMYKWRKQGIEFYVDFETVSDVVIDTDFTGSLIFMIGVGWYVNDKWNFKCFITDRLLVQCERKILIDFHEFISQVQSKYRQTRKSLDVRLWHWGHAEKSLYVSSMARHMNIVPSLLNNWCDMLCIFRDEPIVSRGMLNFSLKTVVKAFYDNGFIQTSYIDSHITNGLNAMMLCIEEDNICSKNRTNLSRSFIIQQIQKYNEIDCKVVGEILQYLRKEH